MPNPSILQRIFMLAEKPPNAARAKALAAILRKLTGEDSQSEKAHVVTGLVSKLPEAEALQLVAIIESLGQ